MNWLGETLKIDVWEIAKWFYVGGFGLYLLFSLVVWRQIQLMSKTLNGTLQTPIKAIGSGLVVMAVVAVCLAVVIL